MERSIKTKGIQFAFSMLCLGLTLLLQMNILPYFNPFIKRIDGLIYDAFTKLNLREQEQITRVIIIDIDEESIKAEGRWPWPRDKLATLLEQLKKAGVAVVVFDIIFSEPEKNYARGLIEKLQQLSPENKALIPYLEKIVPTVDSDQTFAKAIKHHDVVLSYLFHHESQIKKGQLPPALLIDNGQLINALNFPFMIFQGYNATLPLFVSSTSHQGFVSTIPDLDGTVRHGLLLAKFENKIYANLALSTVMDYLLTDHISLVTHDSLGKPILDGIRVSGIFIPTNAHGEMLIPFWGLPGTIDSFSATKVLNNQIPLKALAGSVAIVGSSRILAADLHQSPVSQRFPGVEIQANMISGILSQQIFSEYAWDTPQGAAEMILSNMGYAIVCTVLGPILLLLLYIISLIAILGMSFWYFYVHNLYITPTYLLLSITLQTIVHFSYHFILERKKRNRLQQLFSQYIPPSHIQELTESPENYSLRGETREMTVFFSDIQKFTTLTESLDADEVKRLLNTFFTPITDIIFKHHGTIDKYVGDMIMAFWGAPIHDSEHAYHAISAALDVKSHLSEINDTLQQERLPTLKIGMGISSGLMNVGDMGSKFRRAYTVLGDTVNLASRLQDLTRFYQIDILVSDATHANQHKFCWQAIDKVTVKGRQNPLTIYSPLGYDHAVSDEMKARIQTYEHALAAYYQQDWHQAKNLFEQLHQTQPEYYLYQLYLSRIEIFCQNPPSKDWDGTFVHIHK